MKTLAQSGTDLDNCVSQCDCDTSAVSGCCSAVQRALNKNSTNHILSIVICINSKRGVLYKVNACESGTAGGTFLLCLLRFVTYYLPSFRKVEKEKKIFPANFRPAKELHTGHHNAVTPF